jgi:hypothetical protein
MNLVHFTLTKKSDQEVVKVFSQLKENLSFSNRCECWLLNKELEEDLILTRWIGSKSEVVIKSVTFDRLTMSEL